MDLSITESLKRFMTDESHLKSGYASPLSVLSRLYIWGCSRLAEVLLYENEDKSL